MQLVLLQASQLAQAHIHYGSRLYLIQLEALHQALHRILRSLRGTDNANHLVDIVACNDETFDNMGTLLCLAQIKLCAADYHIVTVLNEVLDAVLQSKQTRTPVNQRYIVNAERALQVSELEQLVEHHIGIGIALHIHHDTHTLAACLIVNVADAHHLLLVGEHGYLLDKLSLVHTVGNLSYHDSRVSAQVFYLITGTHHHATFAGRVSVSHALQAAYDATRGEVGSRNKLHQLIHRDVWIIYVCHTAIDNFAQIVGRHVGGHTYGNTRSTIDQEVRYARRHHCRLLSRVVEVIAHIHRLLVEVLHHRLAQQAEACLGVSHRCRRVAVYGAEVAVAVHQHLTHIPWLGQAHQSAIHRAVTVGMILTEHLTHDTGALLVRAVMRIANAQHTIEDTAVHRLEAIPYVRQRTRHDNRHGVIDVAAPHLAVQVHFYNPVVVQILCFVHTYTLFINII